MNHHFNKWRTTCPPVNPVIDAQCDPGARLFFRVPTLNCQFGDCLFELMGVEKTGFKRVYPPFYFDSIFAQVKSGPDIASRLSQLCRRSLKMQAKCHLQGSIASVEWVYPSAPFWCQSPCSPLQPLCPHNCGCVGPQAHHSVQHTAQQTYITVLVWNAKTACTGLWKVWLKRHKNRHNKTKWCIW